MADEWSTDMLALRVVKLLANWEKHAAEHHLEGAPIALHAEHFWEAFGERTGEAIDHARIKGWVTDLGPTSTRHYRLTGKGRNLAADVTVIGPATGRTKHGDEKAEGINAARDLLTRARAITEEVADYGD